MRRAREWRRMKRSGVPVIRHARPLNCVTAMILAVWQEADPRVTRDAAAGGVPAEVVAGDPQAGVGEQHVIRAVPAGPAVQARLARGVQDQRAAGRSRGQPGQAGSRYRAWTFGVAGVLVVEPSV